jgi:glycosyltransferase involved in cell wall biosynthesis
VRYSLFLGNAGHDSGGPENYEVELVRAISRLNQQDEFHLLCLHKRARKLIAVEQPNIFYHGLPPSIRPVSMTFTVPWRLSRLQPRLVHSTFMPPPFTSTPQILTLVCFSMFEHPEFYPRAIRVRLQALMRLGVKSAHSLLCISQMVRERFAEKFGISRDRMPIVPLGASRMFHPQPPELIQEYLAGHKIRDPYFLFCGRWEARKNLLGIIDAFDRFKRETRAPHKLVLTGKRTWIEAQAEALIHERKLRDEVIDLGKVPVTELPLLYGGAVALVYASFYESFGMPIIEAMASGTPVITSTTSAMPETAGGAALLVDPYRIEEISAAMHQIANDSELRKSLRERGLAHASAYTWDATAKATLAAYRQLAAA